MMEQEKDIVERLRAKLFDDDTWVPDRKLFVEAAVEIERLRAKLREIAECEHCEGGDHVTLADMGQERGRPSKLKASPPGTV